ncbi:MAG TPA: serine hydrolase [Chitinophagaceae bacterium]|nr:serine hydrolase [Chitinophagaceae bacterium]
MKKIFMLMVMPFSLAAQKNYPQLLEQYMKAQMNIRDFSGTILVMKQNKVLLKKGYGMADREWNIPNTPDSKFRIGSITKQFTSACVLQMIDARKLSLDDKLSKFYPDFPKGDSVTIHMLLNHTSGIPNYTDLPEFGEVAKLSLSKDSMVSFFKNKPYNFSPGTKWSYTNSGYFLLGCILEKISGQSYTDYLQKNIFDKIGMKNSGVDRSDSVLAFRARGYSKENKRTVNAGYIGMDWPFSAGVLFSTVEDLYKWDRALYGNTIISDAARKKMLTPGKSNYGYGFVIDSVEKHLHIWHNGGINGFLTNISRYVNDDICIVVLSNNESNVDFVSIALADVLFDVPVEIPYIHKEVKIDPALLERYIGKYSGGFTLELIKKDGKLYRHREGVPDVELKPESETKFFYGDDSDRQLEFEVDATGKVVKTWFYNSGQKGEIKKM